MSKKDSPRLRRRSTINRKPTVTVKPARKTRSRMRRPKYLSLRLQLSPEKTQQSRKMTMATARSATTNHRHQQLNLFPLHPENLVEEKDTHDENMAYFFDSADGGATTLTTLFGARSSSSSSEEDNSTLSPSLTYAYGEQYSQEGALVRTAMRNKERDASEERWVCYSEVVERKDEEVTSCAGAGTDGYLKNKSQNQRLSLKLDYEEILNAWSDKGPLYIQLESPQTVPDLSRDLFFHESSKGVQDGWGSSNGGLWTVPENSNFSSSGMLAKVKEEAVQLGGGEEWKVGQREASVLRYKEKRQNRLFSKRIRYEVRKINAEKRPRLKGRFVKRN